MPYTIGSPVENSIDGTGQSTVDAPNFTAVAGDLLIAAVVSFGAGGISFTLSDTVGANDSWTEVGSGLINGNDRLKLFFLPNAAAGSCTVRCTFGSAVDYPAIYVVPVSGIVTSLPNDMSAFQAQATPTTGTDAVSSGATATLSSQPQLVFGFSLETANNTGPAVGTGNTNIGVGWTFGGGTNACRAQHRRVTATTAVAATFTAVSNSNHMTGVATFIEAGGGGATRKSLSLLGCG